MCIRDSLEAVHPREHHVEQDDVERSLAGERSEPRLAVFDVDERDLVRLEVFVEQSSQIAIVVGPIEIDVAGLSVSRGGAPVSLTSYEFRILVELAKRAGDTVTREDLASLVREQNKPRVAVGTRPEPLTYDPSVDRSLDVHVSRLRQKLEDDPKEPRFIKTVRGVGYVLARPS